MTVYASLPYVKKTGLYSVNLPNMANISFSYYYYLIIYMLSFIPGKYSQTYKPLFV